MQNDKIISEILGLVATEDEKDSLTLTVEDLLLDLYKIDHSEFKKKMGQMEEKISALVKAVPSTELSTFLTKLKEKLIATPSIKVILSFKPTLAFTERLNKTLGAIVEVEVNPDILGGVIVESNGKYLDMSVKKDLDALYEKL